MRFTAALCVLTILRYVAAATAGTLRVAQNKPSEIADIDLRNLQMDNSNTSSLFFIDDFVNAIAVGQPLVFAVRSDFDGDANVTMSFQVSYSNQVKPGSIFNETKSFRFYKGMNYFAVESYPPNFLYYVPTWTIESSKLSSPFKQLTARYMKSEPKLNFRYITEPKIDFGFNTEPVLERKAEFKFDFRNMSFFDYTTYADLNVTGWPSDLSRLQLSELQGLNPVDFVTKQINATARNEYWKLYTNAEMLPFNGHHDSVSLFKFTAPEHYKTPGSAAFTARLGYRSEKHKLKLIYTDYKPTNHLSFVVPDEAALQFSG